jgi:nucleoside triphosphate diphosphatase
MSASMDNLLIIMARLRHPEHGCPWDLQQDFHSIAPYAIEEAYELADAIERQDMAGLKEELGDLLLQVAFHSQMAQEAGLFDFNDVVAGIADKMRRRHPHVFGSSKAANAAEVQKNWQDIKKDEKAQSGKNKGGVMADIPIALPALIRAEKIGNTRPGKPVLIGLSRQWMGHGNS